MQNTGKEGEQVGGGKKNTSVDEQAKSVYRKQSASRAGTKIRRLVLANNLCYLWSVTYAENMQDREKAIDDFKKFLMRLNYHYGEKVPYIAVLEKQQRGAIHFHLATNKYLPIDLVEKSWQNGFVFVSEHNGDVGRIAAYMKKYLTKELENHPREQGQKFYLRSRGLEEPSNVKIFVNQQRTIQQLERESEVIRVFDDESPLKAWAMLRGQEDRIIENTTVAENSNNDPASSA